MRKLTLAIAVIAPMLGHAASAEDTLKIGYIDPLSGGGASVGEGRSEDIPVPGRGDQRQGRRARQEGRDRSARQQDQSAGKPDAGAEGDRRRGPLSSRRATARRSPRALSDFVTKYNKRNPGKEVLYFNYAAVDPVLTNDKCSYWHFRWDANSDIKMEALTNHMKNAPNIKKVYLINQDYSFGQSVRTDARKMLGAKRPDIQIVGDELHPLLKITDFSPYIAKIKASGADSVITGNWGQDFALLLKAAADAGLQGRTGTPIMPAAPAARPRSSRPASIIRSSRSAEGFANIRHQASRGFREGACAPSTISACSIRAPSTRCACSVAAIKRPSRSIR